MFRSHLALLAVSGLFTLGVISPLAAQVGCDDWPTPAFFKAATAATVQDCLGAGADPNARDEFGFTPLHTGTQPDTGGRRGPRQRRQTPSSRPPTAGADPNARTGAERPSRLHTAALQRRRGRQ